MFTSQIMLLIKIVSFKIFQSSTINKKCWVKKTKINEVARNKYTETRNNQQT